jgi:hypothetical protein
VFAPVVTQMGVGWAHCALSRHCTQVFPSQIGRPDVVQSASTPHWRHIVPTQTGPFALPVQCVLFWHCTHMLFVRLQARLFMGAVAQSASDMQRSWQVALLPLMMQTCGGVHPAVSVHTRHVFVGTLQYGAAMVHDVSSRHCTHVPVAGLQIVRFVTVQLAPERHSTQRPLAVSQRGIVPCGLQEVSPQGMRVGPESFGVPPSLPAVPPLPEEPPVPPDPPVTLEPARPPPSLPPVPSPSSSPPQAGATLATTPSATKSQVSPCLVMFASLTRRTDLEEQNGRPVSRTPVF